MYNNGTTHGKLEGQVYQYAIAGNYSTTAKKCPLNRSEKKQYKNSSIDK